MILGIHVIYLRTVMIINQLEWCEKFDWEKFINLYLEWDGLKYGFCFLFVITNIIISYCVFKAWQLGHLTERLFQSLDPPLCNGITWSISHVCGNKHFPLHIDPSYTCTLPCWDAKIRFWTSESVRLRMVCIYLYIYIYIPI